MEKTGTAVSEAILSQRKKEAKKRWWVRKCEQKHTKDTSRLTKRS